MISCQVCALTLSSEMNKIEIQKKKTRHLIELNIHCSACVQIQHKLLDIISMLNRSVNAIYVKACDFIKTFPVEVLERV